MPPGGEGATELLKAFIVEDEACRWLCLALIITLDIIRYVKCKNYELHTGIWSILLVYYVPKKDDLIKVFSECWTSVWRYPMTDTSDRYIPPRVIRNNTSFNLSDILFYLFILGVSKSCLMTFIHKLLNDFESTNGPMTSA